MLFAKEFVLWKGKRTYSLAIDVLLWGEGFPL